MQNAVYAGALSYLGVQLGTYQQDPNLNFYIEPAFVPNPPDYNGSLYLMASSPQNGSLAQSAALLKSGASSILASQSPQATALFQNLTIVPLVTKQVWMPSADAINRQLYCGYKQARCNGTSDINGISAAWDFGDSDPENGVYSILMWYNSTGRYPINGNAPTQIVRIHSLLNTATDALVRATLGGVNKALAQQAKVRLIGIMEMPKPSTKLTLDVATLVGTLFYTWLLQLLLPVMIATLVQEKEGRLRAMMKMHGLSDAAYWLIMYSWYFTVNLIYTWILIGVGSAIQLSFFTRTDYSFQFVFYFLWVACLVSFSFLLSAIFRSSRTVVVVSFLYTFGTGLIGYLLLQSFVAANDWWAIFFNIVPGFALYRGLYEIAQYAFIAAYQGTMGITWSKLGQNVAGLPAVMIFMSVEAILFLVLAWYLEQVFPGGIGVPRHPLFFLGKKFKHSGSRQEKRKEEMEMSIVHNVEPDDVQQERRKVEALVQSSSNLEPELQQDQENPVILIHGLHQKFPGRAKKIAVRDLALAINRGECFGLLGPNGAGKSTTINILTGFMTPTSGTAWINGKDIQSDMDAVYGIMGVCPQDNLIWPQLTAREHMSFYGRLKNLKGPQLQAAVENSLKSVNLWYGGVADKQAKTYSGGMKRRLSVAISLIGDPLVVYMDEPSTGLDPASRQNLWDVVKSSKPGRGIILTTHSMEEAAVLCDRLGIFVDGQLVCLGNPKELTARYGGYFVFTITTLPEHEALVDVLVKNLCFSARLTYSLAGTRKYELPTKEVSLAGIFEMIERINSDKKVTLLDWGVANATLEEVFIKFAKSIGAEGGR